MKTSSRFAALLVVVSLVTWPDTGAQATTQSRAMSGQPPNILFIIMDDVGIDQMASFGYGGATPPRIPTIDTLAEQGIQFRNTWAMPACSTTRALVFNGRLPARTNINTAIGSSDLANSMMSPYELTTPRLLAQQGYQSALFGKFHIALQGMNEAGLLLPYSLGWDYFAGWMDETGDPSSIDTWAGIATPKRDEGKKGPWSCGFVGGALDTGTDSDGVITRGANSGACYMPDSTCSEMSSSGAVPPGRTCRDQGGIFDPKTACADDPPWYIDFGQLSGHYVSPFVINEAVGSSADGSRPPGTYIEVPLTDLRARRFRGQVVVEEAIEWILSQPQDQPWMATVSFATAHTPVMQPPVTELRNSSGLESRLDCSQPVPQRVLTNLMIEAMDTEITRLLVETGLATERHGRLHYNPAATDTVIVILGDNGTFANTVKLPFQPRRAKGTAYQTGVWVPLIVAGPGVTAPGRAVEHMVNAADLYQLFGELAGIDDVHAAVPRPIDSETMLRYLTRRNAESVRAYNLAQTGPNLQANGGENPPCVISGTCIQLPPTQGVCNDNGGIWWGEQTASQDIPDGAPVPPIDGVANCCAVNEYIVNELGMPDSRVTVAPGVSAAARDDRFKLVRNITVDYVEGEGCQALPQDEFYEINQSPVLPRLDYPFLELDQEGHDPLRQRRLEALRTQLDNLLLADNDCPGDGNLDFVVDQADLDNVLVIAEEWGGSSTYDFNLDGLTDDQDIQQVQGLLPYTVCPILVVGQNDPRKDPQAVRAAVNLGVERGGDRGRVVLEGVFDFGDCASCIEINGPVLIEGTSDPSGPAPIASATTISSSARAPFVIADDSDGTGTIRIERLWFDRSDLIAIEVERLAGGLELENNRFTGITGASGDRGTLRFAVGGASPGLREGSLRGWFRAVDNHIDTRDVSFKIGDDNGFAFAKCEFDRIEIRDNRIYTRGEGVEVEGCSNAAAVIEVVGNELITDAAISNLAPLTKSPGLVGIGGHPAVLKVIGSEASQVLIADNDVTLSGWHTAICIMPGLTNRAGTMQIRNNYCQMSGQFAALLAGWAGTPGFFPPFYLQNSVVENNVFEGTAQYGVAFADFAFLPARVADEVNRGNNNLFQGNSFLGLETSQAALYFGPRTRENVFIGDPNGRVIDRGRRNQISAE